MQTSEGGKTAFTRHLAVVGTLLLLAACATGISERTAKRDEACCGGQPIPEVEPPMIVNGYGGCREPICADLARACDDIVRSGCGATYVRQAHEQLTQPGNPLGVDPENLGIGDSAWWCDPATSTCSETSIVFEAAVHTCIGVAYESVRETVHENRHKATGDFEAWRARVTGIMAFEVAACTRRAANCEERFSCSRAEIVPPRIPDIDLGNPPAEPLPPPVQPERPWQNETASIGRKVAKWDEGGAAINPMTDSASCSLCAIERCRDKAFWCFGAEDQAGACDDGNCCQNFRRCMESCGGDYAVTGSIEDQLACAALCEQGRPDALRQLDELETCVRQRCSGCQALDNPVQGEE
jgi:hypothetical protein